MAFGCARTKKDLNKCLPFAIVGAILLFLGIPLMLAGIIGGFRFSDLIGYVGGVAVFFGILFLFVWYVITIPNLEKLKKSFVEEDSGTKKKPLAGSANAAFEGDVAKPSCSSTAQLQEDFSEQLDSKYNNLAYEKEPFSDANQSPIVTTETACLNQNSSNNKFLIENEISNSAVAIHSKQRQVEISAISIITKL